MSFVHRFVGAEVNAEGVGRALIPAGQGRDPLWRAEIPVRGEDEMFEAARNGPGANLVNLFVDERLAVQRPVDDVGFDSARAQFDEQTIRLLRGEHGAGGPRDERVDTAVAGISTSASRLKNSASTTNCPRAGPDSTRRLLNLGRWRAQTR